MIVISSVPESAIRIAYQALLRDTGRLSDDVQKQSREVQLMLRPMIEARRVAIAEIEAWWPDINREPIYAPNPALHRGEHTNQGGNHGNQP
jgi:hypothetical protein